MILQSIVHLCMVIHSCRSCILFTRDWTLARKMLVESSGAARIHLQQMEKYFFKTKSNVFSISEITDCSTHMICETVVILTRVKWLLCGKPRCSPYFPLQRSEFGADQRKEKKRTI